MDDWWSGWRSDKRSEKKSDERNTRKEGKEREQERKVGKVRSNGTVLCGCESEVVRVNETI